MLLYLNGFRATLFTFLNNMATADSHGCVIDSLFLTIQATEDKFLLYTYFDFNIWAEITRKHVVCMKLSKTCLPLKNCLWPPHKVVVSQKDPSHSLFQTLLLSQ